MGGVNRCSSNKKRVIRKRPVYPLTVALVPQAKWKMVNNPVMSRSDNVVAKALYHRVLKK